MRSINKLNTKAINGLRKPGLYSDGLNLYVQLQPSGSKSFLFRYMINGKARSIGFGRTDLVTVQEARDKATAARRLLLDGIDPRGHRDAEKLARKKAAKVTAAPVMTFAKAATNYVAANEHAWKPKHSAQWTATLERYAYPVIGKMDVATVSKHDVAAILAPIWATKVETASRLRGRIESVLDWAIARDHRQDENAARWKGCQDHLMPKRAKAEKGHHAAMAYGDLPGFWTALAGQEGIGAMALRFAILTAARSGEVRGALWSEVDMVAGTCTIPGERMKAGKAHVVPLTEPALAVLRQAALIRQSDLVFNGRDLGTPLSDMSLSAVLRRMKLPDITVHGFRSSFRTFAAEETDHAREVAEVCLAHTIGNAVEQSYSRGDMLAKRRKLMNDWSTFVLTGKSPERQRTAA